MERHLQDTQINYGIWNNNIQIRMTNQLISDHLDRLWNMEVLFGDLQILFRKQIQQKKHISQFSLRAIAIFYINRKASVFYSVRKLGFHSSISFCLFYKIISLLIIRVVSSLSLHHYSFQHTTWNMLSVQKNVCWVTLA